MGRIPEFAITGVPIWWHHRGLKMGAVKERLPGKFIDLVIEASASWLKISVLEDPERFMVRWRIQFSASENAEGSVVFTAFDLCRAFELPYDGAEQVIESDWLLDRFGGDEARQGKFIRYQQYLNIPGPGTGHDGDPHVSLEVDEVMQALVAELIRSA